MHAAPAIIWLLVSLSICRAGESALHRIDADGRHLTPGRPVTPPVILAIGGKPLAIQWADVPYQSPPGVALDRTTATRRVTVASGEASQAGKEWAWTWTPPVTGTAARYELRVAASQKPIAKIEVRDPRWLAGLLSRLSLVKIEATGLSHEEMESLSRIGLHGIARKTDSMEPSLRLVSPEPGAARRHITWDTEHADLVVWRPGPAQGDLEIRAPRWWISPAALATDHGVIRLLELLSEPPVNP